MARVSVPVRRGLILTAFAASLSACGGASPGPKPGGASAPVATSAPAMAVYTDAERIERLFAGAGTVWALGSTGVVRWLRTARRFERLDGPGAPGTEATVMAPAPDGTLYVGLARGLAWRTPDGRWQRSEVGPLAGGITALAPRKAGGVWVGLGLGLGWFDGRALHVISNRHRLKTLVAAPNGVVWGGTARHGVIALQDNTIIEHTSEQGLCGNWVREVQVARDGRVFAVCAGDSITNRLSILLGGRWFTYEVAGVPLPLQRVLPTADGALLLSGGRLFKLASAPGVPGQPEAPEEGSGPRLVAVAAVGSPAPPLPTPGGAKPPKPAPEKEKPRGITLPPMTIPAGDEPSGEGAARPAPPAPRGAHRRAKRWSDRACQPALVDDPPAEAPKAGQATPQAGAKPAAQEANPAAASPAPAAGAAPSGPVITRAPRPVQVITEQASLTRAAMEPGDFTEAPPFTLEAHRAGQLGEATALAVDPTGTLFLALSHRGLVGVSPKGVERFPSGSLTLDDEHGAITADGSGQVVAQVRGGRTFRWKAGRWAPWRVVKEGVDMLTMGADPGGGAWLVGYDAKAHTLVVYKRLGEGPWTEVARIPFDLFEETPRAGRLVVDAQGRLVFPLFRLDAKGRRKGAGLALLPKALDRVERWAGDLHTTLDPSVGGPHLPDGWINNIALAPGGVMWLATNSGLARVKGTEVKVYDENSFLESEVILGVTVDPDGRIWVATVEGFGHVAGERWVAAQGPMSEAAVSAVASTASGVFAGTDEGLWRMEGESWVPVEAVDGVAAISDLVTDGKGSIWMITAEGPARLDARALKP